MPLFVRCSQRVAKGETDAIEGWLAYGAALNEGRSLFPGDKEFGQWVSLSKLDKHNDGDVHPGEQQAAMWAAANRDQFEEARAAGSAHTPCHCSSAVCSDRSSGQRPPPLKVERHADARLQAGQNYGSRQGLYPASR